MYRRSLSVPLVDRPFWQANEVPTILAGVNISVDLPPGVGGGAHLPLTMSRLSHMAAVTQVCDVCVVCVYIVNI